MLVPMTDPPPREPMTDEERQALFSKAVREGAQIFGAPDAVEALRKALGADYLTNDDGEPLTLGGCRVIVSSHVPPGTLLAVDAAALGLGFRQAPPLLPIPRSFAWRIDTTDGERG